MAVQPTAAWLDEDRYLLKVSAWLEVRAEDNPPTLEQAAQGAGVPLEWIRGMAGPE